jgi:hypothetical protein
MLRRWLGGVATAILAATALVQSATAQIFHTPEAATPAPHEEPFWSIDPGFVVIFEDQSNDEAFVVRWNDSSNDTGFIAGGGGPILEPPPATPTPVPTTPITLGW